MGSVCSGRRRITELPWRLPRLAQDVFGVTLDLQKRLTEAGVEFAEAHRRIVDAPESWRGLFKQRTMLLKGTDDDRVERMYSQVQNFLEG